MFNMYEKHTKDFISGETANDIKLTQYYLINTFKSIKSYIN